MTCWSTPTPGARRVLARWDSPPLSEVATVLMKVSQNLLPRRLKAVGQISTEGGRVSHPKAAQLVGPA